MTKMYGLIMNRMKELKKLKGVGAKLGWFGTVPQAVLDKAGIKAFDNFKA